jgi:uncharacterized protein with NAD-binding domain and iron-sulfur cluster
MKPIKEVKKDQDTYLEEQLASAILPKVFVKWMFLEKREDLVQSASFSGHPPQAGNQMPLTNTPSFQEQLEEPMFVHPSSATSAFQNTRMVSNRQRGSTTVY